MSSYVYADPGPYEYQDTRPQYAVPAPPPPPPPPRSAFSPGGFAPPDQGDYYAQASPLVVAASPVPSRSNSRARPRDYGVSSAEYIASTADHRAERVYLSASGASKALSRSNSERGRDRGQIVVEGARERRGHSRARSEKVYYEPREKYYVEEDAYSNYSGSSYDSRDDSRERHHSSSSRRRRHSRAPSSDSFDDRYAVGLPRSREEILNEKLQAVQKQLEQVQVNAEKQRLQDKEKELEKKHNEEIERKVREQMRVAKQKEQEKERKEREERENEKRRITEAARKLLEDQEAARRKAQEAEEKKKAEIQAILEADRAKYAAATSGKKTYTRFSKTHLCKEALDEKNIPYTEESDYFLVHRFVEKTEQQYLWSRTKDIRNYYRQIQEAADKAPMVQGPNGGYVKYVQIAGQPYPIALPVTIQHTPGGGQTQHVEKVKWSDIFRSK